MTQPQDEISWSGEVDRWFRRTLSLLSVERPPNDPVIRVLALFGRAPTAILDVGTSLGDYHEQRAP